MKWKEMMRFELFFYFHLSINISVCRYYGDEILNYSRRLVQSP